MLSYLHAFWTAILIALLIVIPGLWIRRYKYIGIAYIPTPGIILLSFFGFMGWILSEPQIPFLRSLMAIIYTSLLFIILVNFDSYKSILSRRNILPLVLCGLVFTQALLIGINPLPIAHELGAGGPQPGRMIAGPPDYSIPYQTALYFRRHLNGIEQSDNYFGADWNVASRGPLAPLGINGLFILFNANLESDINMSNWPISSSSHHIASIYGWLTNSFVILACYELLASVKKTSASVASAALCWASVSPITLINTVFTWPKLLATYFIFLSASQLFLSKRKTAGTFAALAWLSHPIGALFLPSLTLLAASTEFRGVHIGTLRKTLAFVVGCLVIMIPWLLYKWSLGHNDQFTQYLFAGGKGLAPAKSLLHWIQARITNTINTLVPFSFFMQGRMKTWLFGPISDQLRWFLQYQKSLPGQLGFCAFLISYLSLSLPRKTANQYLFFWCLLIIPFATMAIFWGFSTDGLGRNTLEPLSLLLIIYSIIFYKFARKALYILMPLISIESLAYLFSGFFLDTPFGARVSPQGLALLAGSAATTIIILLIYYSNSGVHARKGKRTLYIFPPKP